MDASPLLGGLPAWTPWLCLNEISWSHPQAFVPNAALHWLCGSGAALISRPLFCWDKSFPMTLRPLAELWWPAQTPSPLVNLLLESLASFLASKHRVPYPTLICFSDFQNWGARVQASLKLARPRYRTTPRESWGCLPSVWKVSLLDFLHASGHLLALQLFN